MDPFLVLDFQVLLELLGRRLFFEFDFCFAGIWGGMIIFIVGGRKSLMLFHFDGRGSEGVDIGEMSFVEPR